MPAATAHATIKASPFGRAADANAAVMPAASQAWPQERQEAQACQEDHEALRVRERQDERAGEEAEQQHRSTSFILRPQHAAELGEGDGRGAPEHECDGDRYRVQRSRDDEADGGDDHRIRRQEGDGPVDACVGVGRGARPNDIGAGQISVLPDAEVPLAIPGRERGCQPTHVGRDEHQNEGRGRGHDETRNHVGKQGAGNSRIGAQTPHARMVLLKQAASSSNASSEPACA
jgi:hypothetical protein